MTESSLEQQISELEQQLAAKRAQAGGDAAAPYERQEVHEAIGEQIQRAQASSSAQVQQAPIAQVPQSTPIAVDPAQDSALTQQVQDLVNIAFTQSVGEAISRAIKTSNAALIDALHDVLADQLHDELIKRQKLEPAR